MDCDDKQLLFEWRKAYAKHMAEKAKQQYKYKSVSETDEQPRSVKMLNMIAELENRPERYIFTPPKK